MNLDEIYQEIQDRQRRELVLIIGTGIFISVGFDFGMLVLESHFKIAISMKIIGDKQAENERELILLFNVEHIIKQYKAVFNLLSLLVSSGFPSLIYRQLVTKLIS